MTLNYKPSGVNKLEVYGVATVFIAKSLFQKFLMLFICNHKTINNLANKVLIILNNMFIDTRKNKRC
ncbi:MAG TPA: hypothetical protein DD294_12665 [Psychrobacter sp.]|nr:hypothetical protein [Psychrobacter sp.]HCI30355.1 hypothetical protein [Psychrobacter sp.]